ncbi:MAG: ANTAR domain-containing protein [Hyphomicrobiaceae bacterium]|nr:ANTAR domain-containing protein [Hyphomicrobiaceae bacterium]
MFAHARWILARIWRTQAEPGVVVDERNTISKACHVLMCRSKCSEEDAFAALRARAMDRRMPLVKLASLVLDS